MPGSGISVRLASARVVCTAHWSTGSYDMARSTHLGGRSYYDNLQLTHPRWGSLYSACGRSMDLHLRHQAAQRRTWDGSSPWLIRHLSPVLSPRSDQKVQVPPHQPGSPPVHEDTPCAPSQAWKLLPLRETVRSLSTVHTLRADASSAWKSLLLGDETVGALPTEHRLPETMSMATSRWKRPHIETSTHESRPSQGDSSLSTGQSSTAWETPDV